MQEYTVTMKWDSSFGRRQPAPAPKVFQRRVNTGFNKTSPMSAIMQ